MLYVMWKNVGRRISHQHTPHVEPKFKLRGVIFGPLLGTAAVIIGICVFVIYQVQATGSAANRGVFLMYYSYYVVLLPMMTVGALVGTIIHSLEARELDTLKNPTRSLDVILLMGAALGQIGMSYFSIVAIVATNPWDLLNSLILAYSVILIIQHITQNIFIIEGIHRQPWAANIDAGHARAHKRDSCSHSEERTTSNSSQQPTPSTANKEAEAKEQESHGDCDPKKDYPLEIRQEIRRLSQAYLQTYNDLNWKRKALKEISFFLILCNIIVSIFEAAFCTRQALELN